MLSRRTALAAACGGGVAVVAIALGAVPVDAQSAKDFFKGKTLTYIVATAPGGGYDTYARLIAEYMEKQLPGTKIVVKNIPGAGHIIGTNQLYAAKPDGLTIGTFNTGLIYAQLLKQEGVQFDLSKMTWIGKAAADPRVVVMDQKSSVKTFDDLMSLKEEERFAASGPGSASYNETKMLISALDLNVKLIPGYNGQEGEMAMLRGEIGGQLGSLSSLEPFVKNGYGHIVLQIGGKKSDLPPGAAQAPEDLPAGKGRSVAALIASQAELARLTAAPPGVPADRAEVLIVAYRGALEDPGLTARADKLDRPVEPLYGEDVARLVKEALDQPEDVITMVRGVLSEEEVKEQKGVSLATELLAVSPDGRNISFKGKDGGTVESKVSGSRTKIMIGGAESTRENLKVGMNCEITYEPGEANEPSTVTCN